MERAYEILFTAALLVIGLALAVLFQRQFTGRAVYRAFIFSPWVTPTVAVSIVWVWLFNVDNGLLNHLLTGVGLPANKWISSRETALMYAINPDALSRRI